MASGTDSSSGLDAASSLEIALDQAIARRYAGASERSSKKRRNTPVQNFAVGAAERAYTPTDKLAGRTSTALALPSRDTSLMRPPARLRWKGIEVSDEFQEYAARVARGEQLEPYRGPVLSRPSAEFPWSAAPERLMLPPARSSQRPSQRPSLAPMMVPVFDRPVSEPPVYPERGRALKTALWLAGAVSSIVGALGVGAGATNTAGNEFDEHAPDPSKLAQKPAPAAARDEALAASLDDTPQLDGSIGERQLASLAAANDKAAANTKAAPAPTRTPTQRLFTAASAPRPLQAPLANGLNGINSANGAIAPQAASGSSTSRLAIPAPGPVPGAGEPARGGGILTMARPAQPSDAVSSHDSTLFSDRAPF
jgi:hypothetical protein